MASIRKKPTGKWEVQIRRKGYKSISRTFTRYQDAKEWSRQKDLQADRRDMPDTQKLETITFKDLLTRYKKEVSALKKGGNIEAYYIDGFLKRAQNISKCTLAELTPEYFSRYRDKRLQQVKPATLCRELGILQHALKVADIEWGIPIRKNPVKAIRKPTINNRRERRLDKSELHKLRKASKKARNSLIRPLYLLAIETGMRRGELLKARWRDVDHKAKTLHIPETKNGYSRTIPLSRAALRILAILNSWQEKHNPNANIFPLSANSVRLAWNRLLNRAGIEDLHFHDLRHEAISRFFERGLNIPEVALISGHKDFRMLFRYTHMRPEDVVKKLN